VPQPLEPHEPEQFVSFVGHDAGEEFHPIAFRIWSVTELILYYLASESF
jgi:hypothetical protein